jgi:FAD/FMN-containing dehydrogenase
MGIMEALERIVGPSRVSNEKAVCDAYKYNPWIGQEWTFHLRPDIVVLAETTEQVSEIVKAANEYEVPVTPKGLLGGGGLGGAFRGGILLDLSRMDKVISIDPRSLKAVAEAGCSFYKFAQELWKAGLHLPTPFYGPAASVASSAVLPATGYGKTRHGPLIDLVEGFEVVLPSGKIARVGAMAYAHTDFGPYYRYITGPDLVGLFSKSNGAFGIVTKVAYQCLKRPRRFGFHAYHWKRDELDAVQQTILEATNAELFDIHLNDKYRWNIEGPFDFPAGSHFDITVMVTGDNETELKGKEQTITEIFEGNGGRYLPGLTSHWYHEWPGAFFAGHPRVRPPVPPNIMNETLGQRSYMFIMDKLMFPATWTKEVYNLHLDMVHKYGLDKFALHPVWDSYPMKRQIMCQQYWVPIDDSKPEQVEAFMQCRSGIREWYGARGGLYQEPVPPFCPDFVWTNQQSEFDLLRTIKDALDPKGIMSPGTFEIGGER